MKDYLKTILKAQSLVKQLLNDTTFGKFTLGDITIQKTWTKISGSVPSLRSVFRSGSSPLIHTVMSGRTIHRVSSWTVRACTSLY